MIETRRLPLRRSPAHSALLTLGLVLVTLCFPMAVLAQWSRQSPLPTHLDVRGVAAAAADHVFLVTDDDSFDDGGALFESTDGGATWVQRDIPASLSSPLNGIFFWDDLRGWVWGNVNYRTLDGGATWDELPFLGSADELEFYSADFGLIRGNFGDRVSRDGGLTWEASPEDMTAFAFLDASTGLGAGPTGIHRTLDGGASFTLVEAGSASAVAWLSATTAVAIVDGVFARSTDGGVSWARGAGAAGRDRLLAIAPDVALAWGSGGVLLRSADGGASWSDLGDVFAPGPNGTGLRFTRVDSTTVVASDGVGNLFRSSDAGATWSRVYTTPGPRPSFLGSNRPAFANATTGYFAFGPGLVVKTVDGGTTWTSVSSGTGHSLKDIARFDDGRLIAVGEAGTVLESSGVAPWRAQPSLSIRELVAVQVLGSAEVVTVDESGQVFRSEDGGATWNAAPTTPPFLDAHDLFFTSVLDGWVTGSGFSAGALFHTSDGGATWNAAPGVAGGYVAVDFAGTAGWAANVTGLYQRTTDGGDTWSDSTLPGSALQITDMDFFDAANGYAVGARGYAARSSDGGETWEVLPTPNSTDHFTDLFLVGPDELWISTGNDRAYYSANGGQGWAILDIASGGFGNFSAIAANPAGDAWVVGFQGVIEFFQGPPPPPLNRPPLASFDFLTTGLTVDLTDTSVDPDGSVVSWSWDFGDGTTSTLRNPSHTFAAADTYHVRLTVTDDDGATGSALRFITAQPGPGGTFGDFTEVTPLDPLWVTPQEEDFWITSTAPADFDGDGDLDIAVLGFYVVYSVSAVDMLVLMRNDGLAAPGQWDFTYIDVPLEPLSSGASDLAWGDYDGDGDPDLVVGSDGRTVIYRNDGGSLTATAIELPAYWEDNDQADFDLRSISWADYDNDGDLDLLLPSVYDRDLFEYRTVLLRNDGPDGAGGWSFSEVTTDLAGTGHAQSTWADFDGDLDLDLLLVHLAPLTDTSFIRRYRNDGAGVFVGEDLLGDLSLEHGEVQWGDYDADGDLDLLLAGRIREPGPEGTAYYQALRIYRNDAETYVPVEVIACPACEGWFDITAATWADYDSDGDVDILVTGNYNSGSQIEGRARVLVNDGGVFTDSGSELPAPRASGTRGGSFTWLDIDGEGDLDYFVAGQYFVPGGNGLVEAQMHLYVNDTAASNGAPSVAPLLDSQVAVDGTVTLWWDPASDDFTPAAALTYELKVYRDGTPVASARRLPEPGNLSAVSSWSLAGLADGHYRWTLEAVDSALNPGPKAEATFTVGNPGPLLIFADGFESGDGSRWSLQVP